MNTIVLIIMALAAQIDKDKVSFVTPGPGSYQVMRSCDLNTWTYLATGHVNSASHVVARIAATNVCEFYVVNFIPSSF